MIYLFIMTMNLFKGAFRLHVGLSITPISYRLYQHKLDSWLCEASYPCHNSAINQLQRFRFQCLSHIAHTVV